ncbi:MAG: hypothetical protein ACK5QS_11220 [Pseudanabaenaceae cyanobacterium]|jgi:hypothetical protein
MVIAMAAVNHQMITKYEGITEKTNQIPDAFSPMQQNIATKNILTKPNSLCSNQSRQL